MPDNEEEATRALVGSPEKWEEYPVLRLTNPELGPGFLTGPPQRKIVVRLGERGTVPIYDGMPTAVYADLDKFIEAGWRVENRQQPVPLT